MTTNMNTRNPKAKSGLLSANSALRTPRHNLSRSTQSGMQTPIAGSTSLSIGMEDGIAQRFLENDLLKILQMSAYLPFDLKDWCEIPHVAKNQMINRTHFESMCNGPSFVNLGPDEYENYSPPIVKKSLPPIVGVNSLANKKRTSNDTTKYSPSFPDSQNDTLITTTTTTTSTSTTTGINGIHSVNGNKKVATSSFEKQVKNLPKSRLKESYSYCDNDDDNDGGDDDDDGYDNNDNSGGDGDISGVSGVNNEYVKREKLLVNNTQQNETPETIGQLEIPLTSDELLQEMHNRGILATPYDLEDLCIAMHHVKENMVKCRDLTNILGLEDAIRMLDRSIYGPCFTEKLYGGILAEEQNHSKLLHMTGPPGSGMRTLVSGFAKAIAARFFCISGSIRMPECLGNIAKICSESESGIAIVYFDHCSAHMEEYEFHGRIIGDAWLSKELVYLINHGKIFTQKIWWIIGSTGHHQTLLNDLRVNIKPTDVVFANPPNRKTRSEFIRFLFSFHFMKSGYVDYDPEYKKIMFDWILNHSRCHTYGDIYNFCVRVFKHRIASLSHSIKRACVTGSEDCLRPTIEDLASCAFKTDKQVSLSERDNIYEKFDNDAKIFSCRHITNQKATEIRIQQFGQEKYSGNLLGSKRTNSNGIGYMNGDPKRRKTDESNIKMAMSQSLEKTSSSSFRNSSHAASPNYIRNQYQHQQNNYQQQQQQQQQQQLQEKQQHYHNYPENQSLSALAQVHEQNLSPISYDY